jgi:CBS domain-containing protein
LRRLDGSAHRALGMCDADQAVTEAAMALTVREVMNPETFTVREGDPIEDTLATLLALGLSAAPVVDGADEPIGMVSWRDLVKIDGSSRIAARMKWPAAVVNASDSLEAAGRVMATSGYHHLPVIGAGGKMVGFVSVLDVMRGMLGVPAAHPAGFPHYDAATGAVWTDPCALDEAHIDTAPEGPGVIVLIHGGRNRPENVVWAGATHNLRTRLLDLLSEPQRTPQLARFIEDGSLRFRASMVLNPARRKEVAEQILEAAPNDLWRERIGDRPEQP